MNTSRKARTVFQTVLSLPLAFGVAACATAQSSDVAPTGSTATAQATSSSAGRSVSDGIYTAQQSTAGEQLFRQVCSACHSATEFTGQAFERRWTGRTVGDLFQLVQATMPQDAPGSRTAQEYAAVISYFLRLNGHPSGESELPMDVTLLRSIRFSP